MKKVEQKIKKILNKNYIKRIFGKRKDLYFPDCKNKKILDIKIKRISPLWAKKTCQARYEIIFPNSVKKFVRAASNVDGSKKKSFFILNFLYQNGFNRGKFRVPRPLGYEQESLALFYEEASGITLFSVLKREGRYPLKILKELSKFLLEIHSFKKVDYKIVWLNLKDYSRAFKKIKKIMPNLTGQLFSLNKIAFIKRLNKPSWFIQGDFHPDNIIVKGNKIFIIDFDKAGRGHFLFDLAFFCSSFEFPKSVWLLKFSLAEIKIFQETFLKSYSKIARLNLANLRKDLRKFSAKIFLDALYYLSDMAYESWNKISKKEKEILSLKIKDLLLKIREYI